MRRSLDQENDRVRRNLHDEARLFNYRPVRAHSEVSDQQRTQVDFAARNDPRVPVRYLGGIGWQRWGSWQAFSGMDAQDKLNNGLENNHLSQFQG